MSFQNRSLHFFYWQKFELSELKNYETEVTESVFLDRQCLTPRKQREAMGTERRIQEQNTEEVKLTINEETDKVRTNICLARFLQRV